jgi:glycosyltransferase involved in cell wall biosynthesis
MHCVSTYHLTMKILMFGWEFPPHISGGLGTACHGLVKGLSGLPDIQLTFVVPKSWGDEKRNSCRLIGANQVVLENKWQEKIEYSEGLELYKVHSDIIPYQTPEEFWLKKNRRLIRNTRFVEVNAEGKIDFTGSYGHTLFREIRNYALIARQIAEENTVDLVHAHDWLAYPAGIVAARVSRVPLIIHVHATEFDRNGGDIDPRVYAIEKEGMEAADRIIAVSNLTRRTIIEKYGIDPKKVVTIYNGVETLSENEKVSLKNGLSGKIVAFIGRITQQKGPEYFVEAAQLVLQKMDDVRFVMAGSGNKMDSIIEQVARSGLSDRFHFTGFLSVDEVNRLLKISNVFIMPSVSEPFGIVPLEAMRCSVPVIISRQSGVSEILKYAIITDFWDAHAMADAIYGLLNYPALSALLIKKGREEAGNLSWENVAEEVFRIYQQVSHISHFI